MGAKRIALRLCRLLGYSIINMDGWPAPPRSPGKRIINTPEGLFAIGASAEGFVN